jgi:hypothetical protein
MPLAWIEPKVSSLAAAAVGASWIRPNTLKSDTSKPRMNVRKRAKPGRENGNMTAPQRLSRVDMTRPQPLIFVIKPPKHVRS